MKRFGERLKELRKEKGELQKEMAALLGCTTRHYQDVEAGLINVPSKKLEILADYYGVSMDYLMGRTDKREVNR